MHGVGGSRLVPTQTHAFLDSPWSFFDPLSQPLHIGPIVSVANVLGGAHVISSLSHPLSMRPTQTHAFLKPLIFFWSSFSHRILHDPFSFSLSLSHPSKLCPKLMEWDELWVLVSPLLKRLLKGPPRYTIHDTRVTHSSKALDLYLIPFHKHSIYDGYRTLATNRTLAPPRILAPYWPNSIQRCKKQIE